MGFFSVFAKKKVESSVESFADLLIKFDPETATAAQIELIEGNLDKVSEECATARQEFLKEKKEADVIDKNYNQRLAAAEILQTKILKSEDDSVKAEFETALTELVGELEEMAPEVEREKEEAKEAEGILDDLVEMTKDAADLLKTAKKTIAQAQRDVKKAGLREDRAQRKEERSKNLAGIKGSGDKFNRVLDSMKKNADQANAKADAAEMRANLLKPTTTAANDHVKAALAEANGETTGKVSVADRLASLKGGK